MKQSLPQPMISFAQHGEDVILRRVFTRRHGFYIDVGAGLPTVDSVTKYFYDLGWRGINIEPQPKVFQHLKAARRRDINICCAIGTSKSPTILHVFRGIWGYASSVKQVAKKHNRQGLTSKLITVPNKTLNQILIEHKVETIDFLKIDVEGSEKDVLRSLNVKRWKPRVFVIESTLPGSPAPTFKEWEKILIQAGYRCALFDGLNRYYARVRDKKALRLLSLPANTFDRFVPYRWWQLIPRRLRSKFIKRNRKLKRDMSHFNKFERSAAKNMLEYRLSANL